MKEWSATVTVSYADGGPGWTERRVVYAPNKILAMQKVLATYPVSQLAEVRELHETGYGLAENGYTVIKLHQ